jgi:hydrogenase expression/formation protein HypE
MELNCPLPISDNDRILLGHGSGGRLTHRLIADIFYPAFRNPLLEQDHDGSIFTVEGGRMAISTDSFVVDPIFFPGGDIGDLAINGTVNDLACCGAKPLYLTAGFILEEGFPIADLQRIVNSMKEAADKAGIYIVSGDTKVVEHGKCDKIYINTTGIGVVDNNTNISPKNAAEGDVIICSAPIGVHGITILSTRESLGFETNLKSDTAALNKMIAGLYTGIKEIHVLRDPTRGGLSSTLNEIAQAANVEIELDEASLPIPDTVRAASEILGLDPLYIANEGVVLVILPRKYATDALNIMHHYKEGRSAAVIGQVTTKGKASVKMKNLYGGHRIITMLNGDQLPRIC